MSSTRLLPSIGAVNPANAMANALRVGDHLPREWPEHGWLGGRRNLDRRLALAVAHDPAASAAEERPTPPVS